MENIGEDIMSTMSPSLAFAMSFSGNAPYLVTKKNLFAYSVSVQRTFSVGK